MIANHNVYLLEQIITVGVKIVLSNICSRLIQLTCLSRIIGRFFTTRNCMRILRPVGQGDYGFSCKRVIIIVEGLDMNSYHDR